MPVLTAAFFVQLIRELPDLFVANRARPRRSGRDLLFALDSLLDSGLNWFLRASRKCGDQFRYFIRVLQPRLRYCTLRIDTEELMIFPLGGDSPSQSILSDGARFYTVFSVGRLFEWFFYPHLKQMYGHEGGSTVLTRRNSLR